MLPAPTEGALRNIGEHKTSCTLKSDCFEIPDNK